MKDAVYNQIGKTYDATRRADPRLTQDIIQFLNINPSSTILDLGCGTGNYTLELQRHGYDVVGLDISKEMLDKAKLKSKDITWVQGDARTLEGITQRFDACTCILATHHMQDLHAVFSNVGRVLKPEGTFLIFTATPTQMTRYWLNHYFPKIIPISSNAMTEYDELNQLLTESHFNQIETKPFFIDKNFQDLFLHSGKYKPEIYLNPQVRAGISTFALNTDDVELQMGLTKLEDDIESGIINNIIAEYENDIGDYLFVKAVKSLR